MDPAANAFHCCATAVAAACWPVQSAGSYVVATTVILRPYISNRLLKKPAACRYERVLVSVELSGVGIATRISSRVTPLDVAPPLSPDQ